MGKKGTVFFTLFFYCTLASADQWTSSNTWTVLCFILSGILILLLALGFIMFRRLKVQYENLLREVEATRQAKEQEQPKKQDPPRQEEPKPEPQPLQESFVYQGQPAQPEPQPMIAVPTPAPSADNGKKHKLLVIEDHKEIRLYLKLLFASEYNLFMAENGEEGLKTAQEILPDLIITDVMMPVMNGFECCQHLKENLETCHIPIILLTALIDDENVMKGIELGADDYILKPFKPEILKTKVKRLIKSREELKGIYGRLLTPAETPEEEKEQEEELKFMEDPFIAQIVELTNQNMQSPDFNVKKLADMLETSQPTLYRRVKLITNFTINEFIRGIRLKRSAELLRTRKYSVQEVAEMVGYKDQATFRKHFVDFYGTTPSTFTNTGQKN